jgi:hypothetical protein
MIKQEYVFNVIVIMVCGLNKKVIQVLGNVLKTNLELDIATNMTKIKIVKFANGLKKMKTQNS